MRSRRLPYSISLNPGGVSGEVYTLSPFTLKDSKAPPLLISCPRVPSLARLGQGDL